MSTPAPNTDSKKAPLLQEEEDIAPTEAPPAYAATSSNPTVVVGDGNVFSDIPRPGMRYGPGQRQAYVPRAERKGTWSFGFFSCFSEPQACLKACCCPCVSYGQTRHRLHSPGTEAPVISTPCLGYCVTLCLCPSAESIFGLLQRNELRHRLGIDEYKENAIRLNDGANANRSTMFESVHNAAGFLNDTLAHFFCSACALTQEDREVRAWEQELEEDGRLGDLTLNEDDAAIREEGERLLGSERSDLRGLRG